MKFAPGSLASVSFAALAVAAVAGDGNGAWMRLVPAGKFEARDGRKFNAGTQADSQGTGTQFQGMLARANGDASMAAPTFAVGNAGAAGPAGLAHRAADGAAHGGGRR